jgi:hypothetical protein
MLHSIHIKSMRLGSGHPAAMKNDQNADHYNRKAAEYRHKARLAADPYLKSALEAVAREFVRKARDLDAAVPCRAAIQ